MNAVLVSYTLYNTPKVHYLRFDAEDLMANASIREQICGYHNLPKSAVGDVQIVDIGPTQ